MKTLKDSQIILGVTGSIAAYKAVELLRLTVTAQRYRDDIAELVVQEQLDLQIPLAALGRAEPQEDSLQRLDLEPARLDLLRPAGCGQHEKSHR